MEEDESAQPCSAAAQGSPCSKAARSGGSCQAEEPALAALAPGAVPGSAAAGQPCSRDVAPGGELAARAVRCSPFKGGTCWKRSEKEQGGIFNDTCLMRKQEGGFCLFSLLYPPSSLYLLSDEGERVSVPENGAFSRPGSGISCAARLC